jgi:Zn-dependent peptidase ImmA (M78 family)
MNAIAVESVEKDRIPEPAGYGRSMVEAERDAEEMLATAWRKKGPSGLFLPVDPFEIATKLGISVLTGGDFPRDISGGLRKAPGYRDPEILISPHDSRNRQRFTCAHELGHYTDRVKSGDDGPWEYADGRDLLHVGGHDPHESYANRFAAELLMPRDILLDRLGGANAAALAFDFGVTADVMRFRLDILDRS